MIQAKILGEQLLEALRDLAVEVRALTALLRERNKTMTGGE